MAGPLRRERTQMYNILPLFGVTQKRKHKYISSSRLMRMVLGAIDGRWCQVPHDKQVKFNVVVSLIDYKVDNYFITSDVGTPAVDELVEMIFVNTLSQAAPPSTTHKVHKESLLVITLKTINTKIVECEMKVGEGRVI